MSPTISKKTWETGRSSGEKEREKDMLGVCVSIPLLLIRRQGENGSSLRHGRVRWEGSWGEFLSN